MFDLENPLNFWIRTLRIFLRLWIVAALFGSFLSYIAGPAQAVSASCADGGVCEIGNIGPGGGRVFYVSSGTFTQEGASGSMCSTDCKYLEVAPNTWTGRIEDSTRSWATDTDPGVGLGNQTTSVTGASGTAIGSGYQNSIGISAQSGNVAATSAAVAAREYRGGTKSDWFLPSNDELNELYSQRLNGNFGSDPNWWFEEDWYWSSSQYSSGEAYAKTFEINTVLESSIKSEPHYVRPIRAFGPPRTPTKVVITRAPVRTLTPNTVFASQPQITIQDASNRTVSLSAVVTATISAGGTLVGTTTATASDGVATFSNLGVNGTVGSTYTITYTAVGLTVATATVTLTGTNCDGSTTICQIGDFGPGGGLVFYISANGFRCGPTLSLVCKYLEAAPDGWNGGSEDPRRTWASDTDPGPGRGNQGMIVTGAGARGTAIGTGYQNSVAIVSHGGNLPENSAAALARSYTGPNNLTDWYLPSKNELREITIKQSLLAATAGYWSSSESSATQAWDEGNNFNQGQANKWSYTPVRPIRAFGTLTTISSAPIAGVTAPVTGATPVTSVTSGTGYTGTVSWSTAPSTFASLTTYTATITLVATAGYSLTGVNANFFTVSGATSVVHSADSGVITAVFPPTALGAATKVAITRVAVGTQRKTAFTTQPQITIRDASNNTVTSSSTTVTATISAGGTLVGTTTATASDGVATFSNLGVNGTVGSTYTITYTAVGLTVATATVTLTGTNCDGSFTCQVGDTGPGGGKVFYVAPTTFTQTGATASMCSTDCKYFEAAPNTWTGGIEDPTRSWATDTDPGVGLGNQTTSVTGASGTAIGSGYQNSVAIVNQSGNVAASSAAVLAFEYRGPNNLTDWFLPSRDELEELYQKRATVGVGLKTGNIVYWSSSQTAADGAGGLWIQGVSWLNRGKWNLDYVRPIRAFGTPPAVISEAVIGGVTAPVRGATPVTTVTSANGYTGTVSWASSVGALVGDFQAATVYTATITLTAAVGYTLSGVSTNFFTVAGTTSVSNSANSGVIAAIFPATAAPTPPAPTPQEVAAVAPTPVPYLKTLTKPKLNLKDGKLFCTPGTYNAGYTLDGVVQESGTTLFTPSSFTYILLINGITQTSLAVTSSNTSTAWNIPASAAGALITCSVTVSANGVTNTDKSSDNSSSTGSALSIQATAIAAANAAYTAAVSVNEKAYQKALVDNRATWRTDVEKIRTDYYAERDRIKSLPSTKTTRAQASAALKAYTAAQKKSAADYKASQPAAGVARDTANKAALDAKNTAIAKANAAYGSFIESIGYGVLIP